MTGRPLDVLAAGELYIDLLLSGFKTWPQPGQESFAQDYRREIGGGAAITASGLAILGSRVGVLASVGSEDGLWAKQRLASFGADTSRLRFETGEPTGFSLVASLNHDRGFLTYPGANRGFERLLRESIAEGQMACTRHVHLTYAPPLEDAAKMVDTIRSYGCTVSLDTGWHEEWLKDPRAMQLIRHVDIFFPNEMEAALLTGRTAPAAMLEGFARVGSKCTVLKLGSEGCALLQEGAISFAPPREVTPVDTTGAGDCFNAGFLYAWLAGETSLNCLMTANICGALSTESHGGVNGFPSRERLQRELDLKLKA